MQGAWAGGLRERTEVIRKSSQTGSVRDDGSSLRYSGPLWAEVVETHSALSRMGNALVRDGKAQGSRAPAVTQSPHLFALFS